MNADEHQQLGGRYGVKGFPSIKIFGANKNKPTDYQGVYIILTSLFVSSPKHFARNQLHFVKTNLMDASSQNFWESTGVFFRIAHLFFRNPAKFLNCFGKVC